MIGIVLMIKRQLIFFHLSRIISFSYENGKVLVSTVCGLSFEIGILPEDYASFEARVSSANNGFIISTTSKNNI